MYFASLGWMPGLAMNPRLVPKVQPRAEWAAGHLCVDTGNLSLYFYFIVAVCKQNQNRDALGYISGDAIVEGPLVQLAKKRQGFTFTSKEGRLVQLCEHKDRKGWKSTGERAHGVKLYPRWNSTARASHTMFYFLCVWEWWKSHLGTSIFSYF